MQANKFLRVILFFNSIVKSLKWEEIDQSKNNLFNKRHTKVHENIRRKTGGFTVFLTDRAARSIKIGKRTITFIKTSPKNLLAKDEISGLVIQALKSIGQEKIEDDVLIKLLAILKKEKKETILHDAKLAPA